MADIEKIYFPPCRVSFPAVLRPRERTDKTTKVTKLKYELTLTFPKTADQFGKETDPKLQAIYQSYVAAVRAKYPTYPKNAPKLKSPFLNGDEYPDTEGYPGMWIIRMTATENYPPVVLRRDKSRADAEKDKDLIYGGCTCDGYGHWWLFSAEGNTGFSFGLDIVRKVADGEKFGNSIDVEAAKSSMPTLPDDLDSDFAGADSLSKEDLEVL